MKKLYILFLFAFSATGSFAQATLSNSSFENWYSDTASFSFMSFVPYDTFRYFSPVDWTCLNSITMSPGLHCKNFVDSSTTAYAGNKGLYFRTDTIYIDAASLYLTLPGFAVNGNFQLQISALLGGNGLNPAQLAGAGVPFTQKLKAFGFYLKYAPVANDSCLMWAVLKKGSEVVADAKFNTTTAYSSFTYIEKDFTYYTCSTPDTLVILLCCSNPNFSTLGSGNTGLTPGSQMWVDSVELINLPNGFNFPPVANNVSTFTLENTPKTVNVLSSDSDCENEALTISISVNALHGNATLDSAQNIVYTPANGFSGKDTIVYGVNDGHSTSFAEVFINVFSTSNITEPLSSYLHIYPNPANTYFTIDNKSGLGIEVYISDLMGQIVRRVTDSQTNYRMDISDLPAGMYNVSIVTNDKQVTNRKISVVR
jgi:hypothetical protein